MDNRSNLTESGRTSGGRSLALDALSGKPTERVPVALFTWGFDYCWKAADMLPWQLACGGHEQWHIAHMALWNRHKADIIFFSGVGSGPKECSLMDESEDSWHVKDNNTGTEYQIIKSSLTKRVRQTGNKGCDPVGQMSTISDVDRLIPEFKGWGDNYLAGLRRLINELDDRALVLPHHSPAYICACYAFGFERAMEAMLEDQELFTYVCERYAAGDLLRMRQWAEAGAEAVFIADGWASCDIISPEMFDRFALPYQKSIADAAHAAGLKVILWNEGDIRPILDREAALDIDAFAFEQPRKGIDLDIETVRKVFGPDRCLFGNIDSEELLNRNDRAEIEDAVCQQIRMSGKGSPFILSTGSPIPNDVEPEAVDAMITSARNCSYDNNDS
jgi:uroporphyrinogen-III decarboxylase